MEIVKTVDENAAMFTLNGWLDTSSAPDLKSAVETLEDNIRDLVLDFEGLEYLSSSGIREIVLAERAMTKRGGTLTLINVPSSVMDVLHITGLSQRWNILS